MFDRLGKLAGVSLLCAASVSCGLVKLPFRVAGAVVEGTYETGKYAVDASSDALDRRKAKKEKEKAETAKAEAKAKREEEAAKQKEQGGLLPPPDAIPTQEPAIPLDGPPIEPEPLLLPE